MTRPIPNWTWREQVDKERARIGDSTPMVAWEPDETTFYLSCRAPGFPHAVRAYSDSRVYFVVIYDGGFDEWIASVPRSPNSGAPIEEIGR